LNKKALGRIRGVKHARVHGEKKFLAAGLEPAFQALQAFEALVFIVLSI
jgi:hypothetical protein